MTVCHVIVSGCSWVFALETHCLEGRAVHCVRLVRWCAGVGMTVCHVIVSRCSWVFALEAHCLEGRAVHCAAVSRYRAAEEAGTRVGCQDLALGEARCVGLCAGSVAMVH
jgi:hypothetical protein